MIAFFRRLILHVAVPLTRMIGLVQKPEPKMSCEFALDILDKLEDGDVLLSHNEWNLSNLFIPGFWKHAAMFRKNKIIEAVGRGVVNDMHILKWLMNHDNVAVLRPVFANKDERNLAADIANVQAGKPYDFELSPGVQASYCSELIFWSYQRAMRGESPFTMRETMGVETVVPSDFLGAVDSGKFKLIGMFRRTV